MDYNDGGGAGMLLAWLLLAPFLFLIAIAGYVIGSWFLMKVFDKAGVQGRWRAWVPVYNSMVAAKLGDLSPWVMLGAMLVAGFLGQIPVIGWILASSASPPGFSPAGASAPSSARTGRSCCCGSSPGSALSSGSASWPSTARGGTRTSRRLRGATRS